MTITESDAIIRQNLPEQLKDELVLNELRKIDLGKKLGCEDSYVGKWIKGTYMPSLPAALAMAKTLGITLDRLCTGED